ncbi:MAG: hypothetical protein AAFX39_02850 [Pseudomonadota bacterium]
MAEWHAFLFEGRNWRVREDHAGATKGRVGFYTWRFVQAATEAEAEAIARADVADVAKGRLEGTDKSDIVATYEGIRHQDPDVAEFSDGLRGTGFVLYPEKAFVSELVNAFESLSRRWSGRDDDRGDGAVAA